MQSRNKREGVYHGLHDGKHVRINVEWRNIVFSARFFVLANRKQRKRGAIFYKHWKEDMEAF